MGRAAARAVGPGDQRRHGGRAAGHRRRQPCRQHRQRDRHDFQRIWDVGLACCFSFDLDISGLFVQDDQDDRPSGGVRISQRDELAACADALIAQADVHERELLEETKQAILAFYEREESR